MRHTGKRASVTTSASCVAMRSTRVNRALWWPWSMRVVGVPVLSARAVPVGSKSPWIIPVINRTASVANAHSEGKSAASALPGSCALVGKRTTQGSHSPFQKLIEHDDVVGQERVEGPRERRIGGASKRLVGLTHRAKCVLVEPTPDVHAVLFDARRIGRVKVAARSAFAA